MGIIHGNQSSWSDDATHQNSLPREELSIQEVPHAAAHREQVGVALQQWIAGENAQTAANDTTTRRRGKRGRRERCLKIPLAVQLSLFDVHIYFINAQQTCN